MEQGRRAGQHSIRVNKQWRICFRWTAAGPEDVEITADTALRLSRYFGVSAQFWMNLQAQFELELAEDRISEQIESIRPLAVA